MLLRSDAKMIAMNVGRKFLWFSGIESVAETTFDGGEERFGGPAVFEEEIFEAGSFAGLAEDVA